MDIKKKLGGKKATKKTIVDKARPTSRRRCGCMSVHHWLLEQFPNYRSTQNALEHEFSAARRKSPVARTTPYVLTVVVHILKGPGAPNVTVAQVKSQIKVLNQDFRAKNPDRTNVPSVWKGLVADSKVEFRLATKDPSGNATNGIVVTETSLAEFGQNDSMKDPNRGGVAPWNTRKYLNIWVCSLKDGLLGYAQFPGGPPATDGVVISNTAFGSSGSAIAPFNKGRTCTHEVGHYLNLRHIWGDTEDCSGTDFVDDTPNAEGPNYNQPVFPLVSCQNGPSGDMFMNYMDYVDDSAMFMFTHEQSLRMHSALEGPRKSLWT
jgi:hypothetical protein